MFVKKICLFLALCISQISASSLAFASSEDNEPTETEFRELLEKYKKILADSEAFLAEYRTRQSQLREKELRIKELSQETMDKAFETIMRVIEGEFANTAEGFSLPRDPCLEHPVEEHYDAAQEAS